MCGDSWNNGIGGQGPGWKPVMGWGGGSESREKLLSFPPKLCFFLALR